MDTIPVAPSRALLQPLDVPQSRARIRWNGLFSPATALLLVALPIAGTADSGHRRVGLSRSNPYR
jgi:hypothetical protein